MTKNVFLIKVAKATTAQEVRDLVSKLSQKNQKDKQVGAAVFEALERIVREEVG